MLTVEDGSFVKIFAKLLSIHRRTGDQEPQFRPESCDILREYVNSLEWNRESEVNTNLYKSE